VVEAIQEAKRKLVKNGILKASVLNKSIIPDHAHSADNYDWRYFSAAKLF
jgi:asparagine synthase (glutamine-hydrolysing)